MSIEETPGFDKLPGDVQERLRRMEKIDESPRVVVETVYPERTEPYPGAAAPKETLGQTAERLRRQMEVRPKKKRRRSHLPPERDAYNDGRRNVFDYVIGMIEERMVAIADDVVGEAVTYDTMEAVRALAELRHAIFDELAIDADST